MEVALDTILSHFHRSRGPGCQAAVASDGAVSVCPVRQHPYWIKKVTEDGRLSNFLSLDSVYICRRDLPRAYALNGAIYLARREVLLERQTFYTERTYAYIMPPERSMDIDSLWDLYLADLVLRDRNKYTAD